MRYLKHLGFLLCLAAAVSSCRSINSQATTNQPAAPSPSVSPDGIEEKSKRGAEELNREPLPSAPSKTISPTREQIRQALLDNKLAGDSAAGAVGGYKVAHFSHTCNLYLDNEPFPVVAMTGLQQLASSARGDSRVLIFDKSLKLVHSLKAANPLFCDGNRLFFNDYKMNVFYGAPEKQVTGNVLTFTRQAQDINGQIANLNFYKFRDLIR
jgi:hypothetical protein